MYYEALGASVSDSAEELKRAYRRAVRAAHPDTGGSSEAFQRVQDAWAVLGDPERRRAFDSRRAAGVGADVGAGSGRPTYTYEPPASRHDPAYARPAYSVPRETVDVETPNEETAGASARTLVGERWSTAGLAVGGGVGVFVGFSMFGWIGAIVAVSYVLLVVGGIFEERSAEGAIPGVSSLIKASWWVAAAWCVLAVYTVAGGGEWWPVLYALGFGVFGGSAMLLRGRSAPPSANLA